MVFRCIHTIVIIVIVIIFVITMIDNNIIITTIKYPTFFVLEMLLPLPPPRLPSGQMTWLGNFVDFMLMIQSTMLWIGLLLFL